MVLGKLSVPGCPTNLNYSRARAYYAYRRCGREITDILNAFDEIYLVFTSKNSKYPLYIFQSTYHGGMIFNYLYVHRHKAIYYIKLLYRIPSSYTQIMPEQKEVTFFNSSIYFSSSLWVYGWRFYNELVCCFGV